MISTSYPVLQRGHRAAAASGRCALAIMAKAPRPGRVKTRLSPPLTPQQAAELNVCFLRDTAENIAQVAGSSNSAGVVVYTPVGDESAFAGLLPPCFTLLAQQGESFGERLAYAAEDLLSVGFASLCLIDSDSPTMPQSALREVVEALAAPGDRAVIGGADDGGYYLIGLKQFHARLFADISWSTKWVFEQTCERARELGLPMRRLQPWFDVDDAATLDRLRVELCSPVDPAAYAAPHTREYLLSLDARAGAALAGAETLC